MKTKPNEEQSVELRRTTTLLDTIEAQGKEIAELLEIIVLRHCKKGDDGWYSAMSIDINGDLPSRLVATGTWESRLNGFSLRPKKGGAI